MIVQIRLSKIYSDSDSLNRNCRINHNNCQLETGSILAETSYSVIINIFFKATSFFCHFVDYFFSGTLGKK